MIIGFGHRRRMGKDTCANELATMLLAQKGITTTIRHFADSLKKVSCQAYSWGGLKNGLYYDRNQDEKEKILPMIGKSPREIWIAVGNHLREVHPETWIRSTLHDYDSQVLLIPDLRYPNEMAAIKEKNGMVVKVVRTDVPLFNDIADTALIGCDSWNITIANRDAEFRAIQLEYLADGISERIWGP